MPRRTPASGDAAPAARRARTAGSARARIRSAGGRAMVSRQPGSPSSTKPDRKLRRTPVPCGSVSATTRAPRAAACVPASSWRRWASGSAGSTVRMFQLSGRRAASERSVISSISSGLKAPRHPARISSSWVPGKSRSTDASRISSALDAWRLGTGRPSPSLWVGAWELENPMAPAPSAARRICAIASIWSSVASPSTASSPITTRRMLECPARKPALIASPPPSILSA
jgi:hypothetical protein